MPAPTKKVLTQLVDQYKVRHDRLPEEILVHPVALAALALKLSVAPRWNGIRVRCAMIAPTDGATGSKLGITVYKGALRGFDI